LRSSPAQPIKDVTTPRHEARSETAVWLKDFRLQGRRLTRELYGVADSHDVGVVPDIEKSE
jgi:hypothetical protein